MKASQQIIAFIQEREGYGKALDDGSCVAYQETINGKLDVPTIGYGCTKGVKMGDHWTKQQADDALLAELAVHEKRVTQLVTVELNQNQFDALISFDFNCGGLTLEGGAPSGALKAVNSGDWLAAVAELERWDKFGGKPAKALTARRKAEAALFLTSVAPVTTADMPQAATPKPKPVSKEVVAAGSATAVVGVSYADAILTTATQWQAAGSKLLALATMPNAIVISIGAASYLVSVYVLPRLGIGGAKA